MVYINKDKKEIKVCGVVILYNPQIDVVNNINTYINQVSNLLVIDNSDLPINEFLLEQIKSIHNTLYISNHQNVGIAAALNIGAKKALELGSEYLLTMDQDSTVSENLVNEMLFAFSKDENIAILTPFVIHPQNPRKPNSVQLQEETIAMTSGCMMRLSIFKAVGEFLEYLFIDYVDHEFSLRVLSDGYKIFQVNNVFVYHTLGSIEKRRLMLMKVFPTNHNPLRLYYRTRNRLYVYKKYGEKFPEYVREDRKSFIRELLKIILYEKNKIKKLNMIVLGFFDYKRSNFGKLNDVNMSGRTVSKF